MLSGALFQAGGRGDVGLMLCLAGSIVFVALSAALCAPLDRAERRHAVSLSALGEPTA